MIQQLFLNKNDDEIDTILNSNILLYTISDKLSNISNIVIPDKVKMSDSFAENYIEKAEIKNAIKGIIALGITDFNTTIDTNIVLQRSDDESLNTMLNSMIIHYTISNKLVTLEGISIPVGAYDNTLGEKKQLLLVK
ncbi:MAG: hypothetical protein L6U99_08460 [Clostridium sp.]|nr:MAG: hypothetical protein L6U99_08460 [Clostridium sp.]